MSRITESARDRECTIRLPSTCNGNPETSCFCHFRLSGISGMSYKTGAPIGAYGCSACHAVVDTSKDPEVQLAFAHGCMRTLDIMWREGIIR